MATTFEELKLRFLERCASDLTVLEKFLYEPAAIAPAYLRTLIHQMAGAAAAFGCTQLVSRAMRLDHELAAGARPSVEHVRALVDQLRAL